MRRIVVCLMAIAFAATIFAQVPQTISFQGKIVEAGVPVNGTRNIQFKLYNIASGGSAIWTENHTGVSVSGGLFNVELGSITPFSPFVDFSEQYWVGVSVAGGAELSPRYKLGVSPYAMSFSDTIRNMNAKLMTSSAGYALSVVDTFGTAISGFTHSTVSYDAGVYGFAGISSNASAVKGVSYGTGDAGTFEGKLTVMGEEDGDAVSGDAIAYFKNAKDFADVAAVYGECANTDYYGYGGYFKGGYKGLVGIVIPTGGSSYYGVEGEVIGGSGVNYGVYGNAASGTTNYGVYGSASGGTTNWAGYFDGNVHLTGKLTTHKYTNSPLPIAYGFVNSDGSLASGTSNITSTTWNATTEYYEITISGESYFFSNYVTVVTLLSGGRYTACVNSHSDKLLVSVLDYLGNSAQVAFQFVTYKP